MSRKVKHGKMVNFRPSPNSNHLCFGNQTWQNWWRWRYKQVFQISLRSRQGFCPHDHVKYNTFVTFYVWLSFPFLSFPIIFLLTSTGQTGKRILMVEGLNDAFSLKEVPFRGLVGKIWLWGVNNPQKPPKSGRGREFLSQTQRMNKSSYLSQINR